MDSIPQYGYSIFKLFLNIFKCLQFILLLNSFWLIRPSLDSRFTQAGLAGPLFWTSNTLAHLIKLAEGKSGTCQLLLQNRQCLWENSIYVALYDPLTNVCWGGNTLPYPTALPFLYMKESIWSLTGYDTPLIRFLICVICWIFLNCKYLWLFLQQSDNHCPVRKFKEEIQIMRNKVRQYFAVTILLLAEVRNIF